MFESFIPAISTDACLPGLHATAGQDGPSFADGNTLILTAGTRVSGRDRRKFFARKFKGEGMGMKRAGRAARPAGRNVVASGRRL